MAGPGRQTTMPTSVAQADPGVWAMVVPGTCGRPRGGKRALQPEDTPTKARVLDVGTLRETVGTPQSLWPADSGRAPGKACSGHFYRRLGMCSRWQRAFGAQAPKDGG